MEEKISITYLKGFNDGYLLSKFEPVLLSGILKVENPTNEFIKAVKAGHKQFELEKSLAAIKQAKDKAHKNKDNEVEK